MFILKRKYEFHAARKLTKLDKNHPCTNLHGHTFSIKVKVSVLLISTSLKKK